MVKRIYAISVFFLLAILLITPALAEKEQNIVLTAAPIKTNLLPGEWAEFDVTIWNNQHLNDEIQLSIEEEGTQWSLVTRPSVDYLSAIKIGSKSKKVTRVLLKDIDLRRDMTHPYTVTLYAKSRITNSEAIVRLPIYLLPYDPSKINWNSNLSVGVHIPAIVDPRQMQSFTIDIKNNNWRPYPKLAVSLKGRLVNESTQISLTSDEQKTVAFTVTFNKDLPPQEDTLTLLIKEKDDLLYRASVAISVAPYTAPFKKDVLTTERWLKHTEEIKLTNLQNVKATQRILRPAPLWRGIFTKTEPKAQVEKRDDGRFYVWNIALEPKESTTLAITTNFRLIIYILALIGFVVFLFFMFHDPILINKRAEMMKLHEGGISEFRVIVAVKNRRKREIKNVKLIEKLPNLVEFVEGGRIGAVEPSKVIHQEKGAIIHWNMDLTSQEERLITYYIKTKLSILGGFRLPPGMLRFDLDGKEVKIRSNELDVTT